MLGACNACLLHMGSSKQPRAQIAASASSAKLFLAGSNSIGSWRVDLHNDGSCDTVIVADGWLALQSACDHRQKRSLFRVMLGHRVTMTTMTVMIISLPERLLGCARQLGVPTWFQHRQIVNQHSDECHYYDIC